MCHGESINTIEIGRYYQSRFFPNTPKNWLLNVYQHITGQDLSHSHPHLSASHYISNSRQPAKSHHPEIHCQRQADEKSLEI